ncbi:Toxin ParE [Caulifigura coniformis]|uniref:Toxin n=1 Tax=Caulifigura coniformis TaxID=2527983 RepID=A0A517SM57_9PLAN|nr:type II toxin-antitoxin system RelE/ParE family toxin [Caulifigura coniformis]QDT57214.1 Toxin ParE [Caulifigura coniformis]
MRKLLQDRAAERDLIGIATYTYKTWGPRQTDRYLDLLEEGIRRIAQHPEAGEPRDDLLPHYWSVRIEHHVVFYTFTDSEVRIRRVLHEMMDLGRHL